MKKNDAFLINIRLRILLVIEFLIFLFMFFVSKLELNQIPDELKIIVTNYSDNEFSLFAILIFIGIVLKILSILLLTLFLNSSFIFYFYVAIAILHCSAVLFNKYFITTQIAGFLGNIVTFISGIIVGIYFLKKYIPPSSAQDNQFDSR